jgi:hypothetical protein
MADNNFLVIRIHPDSPVDGGTFSSYLEDLQIQVFLAGTTSTDPSTGEITGTLLGETKVNSGFNLVTDPWQGNTYIAAVSKLVTTPPAPTGSTQDFGTTLTVTDAADVAFGSLATCQTDSKMFASNTSVAGIPLPSSTDPSTTKLTLNQNIQDFAAQDTVVTFYFAYGPASADSNAPQTVTVNWTGSDPFFQFEAKVKGKVTNSKTVKFAHSDGIAVNMTMTTSGSGVPANTTVAAVPNGTSITLSNPVNLADGATVTFTSPLSSGIVQHVEPLGVNTLIGTVYVPIPASVATAIIPFNRSVPAAPANSFLDVTVVATRGGVSIPVDNDFYDVIVTAGSAPTPDQYQSQPLQNTSLYLTLPPPPNGNPINLTIPTDGTASNFLALYNAMNSALTNDTYFAGKTLVNLTATDCSRMAYDIIWSQQGNALPSPPDPLESLYTVPPATGGSTSSSGGTNNLEQDRQQFEGTVGSFYATRNATAQRLAKFVAAASAALYCEQTSLNSTTALLEFPVDAPSSSFATSVESELLLEGLGTTGTSGLAFGVPAAFFYAIGASLDTSTTALQRFQLATGDAIERLLQVFSAAEQANSIADQEGFHSPNAALAPVTSFQAARRLVALGVSSASNSPAVPVYEGTPLAYLVADWLAQTDPTLTLATPPNPPPTYQDIDFDLWSQSQYMAQTDPTHFASGYLFLDLDTLTQGYLIPPFTASPSQPTGTGANTLTFNGTAIGIGVGMPVGGSNIAPGTTVTKVDTSATTTTVTLSAAVTGNVETTAVLTFNCTTNPISLTTSADCPSGNVLPFASTAGIQADMSVSGPNIPAGTTVQGYGTTSVTLNGPVSGDVPKGSPLTFLMAATYLSDLVPVIASTTADASSGKKLTFASTSGITVGMSVFGTGIGPGTTVASVAAKTVTLNNAVAADVPKSSVISFVSLAGSLADQIAAWLPTTTTPATPNPTVDMLKRVTASQWTTFFTDPGNASWLPPFTQPVAPGASPGQVTPKAGYVAMRIRAFIRAVQQFFSVSSVATAAQLPAIGAPRCSNWRRSRMIPFLKRPNICRPSQGRHSRSVPPSPRRIWPPRCRTSSPPVRPRRRGLRRR